MPVNNLALHVRKRMFMNYKAGTVDQHVSQMSHTTATFSSEGSNLFLAPICPMSADPSHIKMSRCVKM